MDPNRPVRGPRAAQPPRGSRSRRTACTRRSGSSRPGAASPASGISRGPRAPGRAEGGGAPTASPGRGETPRVTPGCGEGSGILPRGRGLTGLCGVAEVPAPRRRCREGAQPPTGQAEGAGGLCFFQGALSARSSGQAAQRRRRLSRDSPHRPRRHGDPGDPLAAAAAARLRPRTLPDPATGAGPERQPIRTRGARGGGESDAVSGGHGQEKCGIFAL